MTTLLGLVLVAAILVIVARADDEFRRIRRVRYAILQLLEGGVYTIPELFQRIEGAQECHECAMRIHRAVRALVDAGLIKGLLPNALPPRATCGSRRNR